MTDITDIDMNIGKPIPTLPRAAARTLGPSAICAFVRQKKSQRTHARTKRTVRALCVVRHAQKTHTNPGPNAGDLELIGAKQNITSRPIVFANERDRSR